MAARRMDAVRKRAPASAGSDDDEMNLHPSPDRHRIWGASDSDAGRYGCAHLTLRIFPPDITTSERRRWRLLHLWPVSGLVIAVLSSTLLVPFAGLESALLIGLIVWLLPLVALWLSVGTFSERIHELTSHGGRDGSHDARWNEIDVLVHDLDAADEDLAEGRITAREHRDRWQRAYDVAQAQTRSRRVQVDTHDAL